MRNPLKATIAWLRSTKPMNALLFRRPVAERRVHDGILWSRLAWSRKWQPCCLKCTGSEVEPLHAREERVAFVAGGTSVRAHHVYVRCGRCKEYRYILTDEYEKRQRGTFT
ncbi:MAG: hypothetical protein HY716_16235 [Planctomycetes bacterium]|nr:hypothetical protein [Planctomycetota bacterium]